MKLKHVFHGMTVLLVGAVVLGLGSVPAVADGQDSRGLKATPFEYVGAAGDCGALYPAGSRIVTAVWLKGLGLPDNGGFNVLLDSSVLDSLDNPNKKDPHTGLLLSKNGTTADCSAAGAEITKVKGLVVSPTFTLGYDYRNGGHCGAGAPRFNVDTDQGFFFVGCANAPQTPAPQDPLQWSQTRSVLSTCGVECFPGPIPVGAKINSISIIFDEGTDTANNDTQGVGLAVLDNIFIDGVLITAGDEDNRNDNDKDRHHEDGHGHKH